MFRLVADVRLFLWVEPSPGLDLVFGFPQKVLHTTHHSTPSTTAPVMKISSLFVFAATVLLGTVSASVAGSKASAHCLPTGTENELLTRHRGGFKLPSKATTAVSPPVKKPTDVKKTTKNAKSIEWGGVSTVLGGALAHLALGTLYCWGNFQSYVPKHLLFFDGTVKSGQPDAALVFPLTITAQVLGLPLGPIFQKRIGERNALLLGCLLMATGVFLSSFATSLSMFMLFYSLFFGVGVGIAYTAPIVAGWKWFPDNKGLVSGAVLTGFGAGGFFFNLLGTKIINPLNEKPIKGAFSPALTAGFAPLLRKLAGCYVALAVLGSLLVSAPKSPAIQAGKSKAKQAVIGPDYTPGQALTSLQFWWIWAIILLMSSGSLATAGVNKAFGLTFPELRSDSFLSMVLALSALFNGGGRLFWGSMSDKFGFKHAFIAMATVQAVTLALYDKLASSKLTFALGTMSVYFTLGGVFAMFPPAVQKRFGARNGVTIYSYLFTAFALASVGGSILAKRLVAYFGGYENVFKIFSASSVGALGLAALLPEV